MDFTIYQVMDIVGALGVTKYDSSALEKRIRVIGSKYYKGIKNYSEPLIMDFFADLEGKGEIIVGWRDKVKVGGIASLLGRDEGLVSDSVRADLKTSYKDRVGLGAMNSRSNLSNLRRLIDQYY